MATYALVDLSHLFQRAKHVVRGDPDTQAAMAMLIVLRSLRALYRDHQIDHVVVATDGGKSWRLALYPGYKAKRRIARAALDGDDREAAMRFFGTMAALTAFLTEKTRCSVLHSYGIEADDFIGRWISLHPDDQHIIVSSDSDFVQLLAPHVRLLDAMEKRMIALDRITNERGEALTFTVDAAKGRVKIGPTVASARKLHETAQKPQATRDPGTPVLPYSFVPEPDWHRKALFLKIIRGDAGDGIFGAYPGVRMKGSASKPGLEEAWQDRHDRTYFWNNVMGAEWDKTVTLPDGRVTSQRVTVREEYARNEQLIDLTCQPETVKQQMDDAIWAATHRPKPPPAGIAFMKFCAVYDLASLSGEAMDHAAYLNAAYHGPLVAMEPTA